ncbi:MAG: hypothetical protein AAB393_16840 [Bacteroidota bacterium]
MKRYLVMMWAIGVAFGARAAGQGKSPESLGAHWARVSDEAQVGFVLDELKGLAHGRGSEGIVRKHVARNIQLSSIIESGTISSRPAGASKADIAVEGSTASVKFLSGGAAVPETRQRLDRYRWNADPAGKAVRVIVLTGREWGVGGRDLH